MPGDSRAIGNLIRRVYFLARPFGRDKLALVLMFSLAQGVFQVVGVTSVFPFLALASNPDRIRNSEVGARFLAHLPIMNDRQLLIVAGVIAILALVMSNAVNLLSELNRTHYAHRFGHWLRLRMMTVVVARPYAYFLRRNSSILVKKVAFDVMQYTTGVLIPLIEIVARAFTVFLLMATLLLVNPRIAMGSAIVLGLFYLTVFKLLGRRRAAIRAGLLVANRGAVKEAVQIFSGIKAIKVHQAERYYVSCYSQYSATQAKLSAWIPVFTSGPRYLIEPIAFGGLVLVVLVLGSKGQNLTTFLPSLGIMAFASYRLLPAIQTLYGNCSQLSTMLHTLDEVYGEFVAAEGEEQPTNRQRSGNGAGPEPLRWDREIVLDDISFSYPGIERPILDRVSVRIEANTSVGLIGQTGAGKSTLVDLLLGLHEPSSGRIEIDGRLLTREQVPSWQTSVGYVPQEIYFLDDSIAHNIALGVRPEDVDAERLHEVCAMAQILDFILGDLPRGFATEVGDRGVRLSGGQRQRLGLARALYHRPSLLILDEATSALDGATEAAVMETVHRLHGVLTIIAIAHRRSTLRSCDRVLEIEQGCVRERLQALEWKLDKSRP